MKKIKARILELSDMIHKDDMEYSIYGKDEFRRELKILNSIEDAIHYLKASLQNSFRHYTWLERDTSWSYEPYDLLCLASFYTGNKKDSIIYAAKALSFEPNNSRLQENLNLCVENSTDNEIL